jgi:hypothetical protein
MRASVSAQLWADTASTHAPSALGGTATPGAECSIMQSRACVASHASRSAKRGGKKPGAQAKSRPQ